MENEIKHNEDNIQKQVGKRSRFSVPTNYFDDVEFDITSKIVTDNFDKTNAHEVPKNYFEVLENQILESVSSSKKTTKVISLKKRILKTIPFAAAACIALFISLNTFVFNAAEKVNFEAISDVEIESWLDDNTMSTSEIATLLGDEILYENMFSFADLEDESIEDYINSIDNSSLLNELN